MTFLGKEGIVHRDLQAKNIMVGENYHVKVAGFRMAKIMDDGVHIAPKGI